MAMFDAVRFVCAIAIIWQHVPESPQVKPFGGALSVFAVPFFVLAATFFIFQSLRGDPSRSFGRYVASRFQRIYVPFLLWTIIYLLARQAKHGLLSNQPMLGLSPMLLLGGSAHHLWFLPYVLVLSIVTFAIAKTVIRSPARLAATSLIFGALGIAVGFAPSGLFADIYLLDRPWNMMPAALWGIALGASFHLVPPRLLESRWLAAAGIAICAVCAAFVPTPYRTMFSDNFAGVGMLMIALWRYSSPAVQRVARLGPLAYGIYLSHILFVEGSQAVAARFGFSQRWWLDLGVFALAALASVVLSQMLSRFRWGRWLVPA